MTRENGTPDDPVTQEIARRQEMVDRFAEQIRLDEERAADHSAAPRPRFQPSERPTTVEDWATEWRDRWYDKVIVQPAYAGPGGQALVVRVLHPAYPGWQFRLTFSSVSGAMVGFHVVASDLPGHPAPALTARFLRGLPVGEIEAAARSEQLREADEMWSSGLFSDEVIERYGRSFEKAPHPGRRGRGDLAYAEVAALYVKACRAGSAHPAADVADALCYSKKRVQNVLTAARRKGLLTAAPTGRHGGELTAEAIQLLEDD